MVANPQRRISVTDAALEVLGSEGARALTHRAVDAHAGLPAGTCANYFPTRAALLVAMAQRIYHRIAPQPDRLAALAGLPVEQALPGYIGYVAERLLAEPSLTRALLELRLEAARNEVVAEQLGEFLRAGLDSDVDFHTGRGLPGGRDTVLLLHHVVNGILLDALTVPLVPGSDPVALAKRAATLLASAQLHAGTG